MNPGERATLLHNAEAFTKWCEAQASGLDPMIRGCQRGEPIPPKKLAEVLSGIQALHRRMGALVFLFAVILWYQDGEAPPPLQPASTEGGADVVTVPRPRTRLHRLLLALLRAMIRWESYRAGGA